MHGIKINETPKLLTKDPDPMTHAMVVLDQGDSSKDLIFPLSIMGVTSYLPVFKPSLDDWASDHYKKYDLTDHHLDWDPSSTRYKDMEDALTNVYGNIIGKSRDGNFLVINSMCSYTVPLADISHHTNIAPMLLSKVRMSSRTGETKSKQGKEVDASTLATC